MATPTWTESALVTINTLARNAVSRTTLDLRAKFGAYVLARIGRGGTTALTNGVDFICRRTYNNDAEIFPAGLPAFRGESVAANGTTCAASGNTAPVTSLTVASTTGYAAGDLICIQDNATPTGLTEWARVARVTSATVLLLDAPTKNSHNSTAHTVRNKADAWAVYLEGGALWEIIVDYGDDTAGESITLEVVAQTNDSIA